MTIQSSGPIGISDVTAELGLGTTYSASLSFLNGFMKNPATPPNLAEFYGQAYFQSNALGNCCLLYTSPSPRDRQKSRMPSSA